ncbi:carbohydrate ABC transporter permease [Bradyrhizobium sp. SRL28]|uniref:carbohydrate ABC transporter permease n=1 Tax=Bradyrhizobium sp. SRL28 TaxID=2836178 RepID=UPI0035ADB123
MFLRPPAMRAHFRSDHEACARHHTSRCCACFRGHTARSATRRGRSRHTSSRPSAHTDWRISSEPINWFGRSYIMVSLILVSVWQFFPFVLLAVLARLQSIPTELYDAARVDGAGPVARFVFVTLPQLASVLFITILLRSIWMFTKFDTVWLMTQGGGAERYIRTMPVYAYLRTFNYYEAGMGAAVAIVMFLMLVAAAATYFFLFRGEDQL